MGKIYIRTYAFNAEKTLRRAVDSVLKQTHEDFVYYLCDNGSQDGTGAIVDEYAKKDKRIKAFHNKINRNFMETPECLFLPHRIGEDDFFCALDADDEYLPTFFEEMLEFMEKFNLDIAACGNEEIRAADQRKIGERVLKQSIILHGNSFSDLLPMYHIFMRTTWGKLFKGRTLLVTIQDSNIEGFPRAYGGDTFNAMRSFGSAERVGILAKCLHRYYISPKSVSYRYHPQRVETDRILHEEALKYLKPYGEVSGRNKDFLYLIYLNALKDTFAVLQHSDIPVSQKIQDLDQMLSCTHTKELAAREKMGADLGDEEAVGKNRWEFFASIAQWLLSLEEVPDDTMELYCRSGEFASAAADLSEGWILFKKLYLQFLMEQHRIDEACQRLQQLKELIPEDEEIGRIEDELNSIIGVS